MSQFISCLLAAVKHFIFLSQYKQRPLLPPQLPPAASVITLSLQRHQQQQHHAGPNPLPPRLLQPLHLPRRSASRPTTRHLQRPAGLAERVAAHHRVAGLAPPGNLHLPHRQDHLQVCPKVSESSGGRGAEVMCFSEPIRIQQHFNQNLMRWAVWSLLVKPQQTTFTQS